MSFNFDAFGNPVNRTVNGKQPPTATDAAHLYCDGVYDPALEMYDQPAQLSGLFTTLENHQVQIHDPASLAKFMYAGHTPVDHIDPA